MPEELLVPADEVSWIVYRNDSGETVPPFGLLRLTGTAQVLNQHIVTATKPDSVFCRYYAVNGPASVSNGKMGECTLTPLAIVRTESVSSAGITYGAKSGQWGLEPNRPGFFSIGLRTITRGLYLVRAIQEPVCVLTGKTDAGIAADASGTVSVHFQSSGSPSEYDITAFLNWMHGSQLISANKQVLVQWVDGRWLITGAECEV